MKKQPTIKKTNVELLAELPEPFRELAIGNTRLCNAGKYPMMENTIPEALLCAFLWQETKEGFKYWENVHQQVQNLKNN